MPAKLCATGEATGIESKLEGAPSEGASSVERNYYKRRRENPRFGANPAPTEIHQNAVLDNSIPQFACETPVPLVSGIFESDIAFQLGTGTLIGQRSVSASIG